MIIYGMKNNTFFLEYYDLILKGLKSVDDGKLIELSTEILRVKELKKKVIIAGNGGSAAIASHVSVDLTKAAKIRSINFNEADLITCYANDYGYERWLVEALKSYADIGDLVILISSSGASNNIIEAARFSKLMGLKVATLSGFSGDNQLRLIGDLNFWVDSSNYNTVEMVHHIWLLAVVDYVIACNKC